MLCVRVVLVWMFIKLWSLPVLSTGLWSLNPRLRFVIEIRELSTVFSGLPALQDWLSEEGCTDVAMESTGVYWRPITNILQSTYDITLGNAGHIKNLSGRKTAINDGINREELRK